MNESEDRRKGHCSCGGIIYREGDYIVCTNCENKCIAKRKTDIQLPSFAELKEEYNG
jgi:hypothetical protein